MSEMSVNWKRLGVIAIGLLSLTMLACLILRKGDDNRSLELSRIHSEILNTQSERRMPNPDRLYYENTELRFSLELPKSWKGYRMLMAETENPGEQLMSVALPVERFEGRLTQPEDLAQGVMLVGIRVMPKDSALAMNFVGELLGQNATYSFSPIPLEAFENGFKEVPMDLIREIEEVYQSFQTW